MNLLSENSKQANTENQLMFSQQFITNKTPIEWITREQGLPSHQLHNLLIVNNRIWLATPNGLAIFDGERVSILDQKNKLQTHGIRTLTKDHQNVLVCSDRGVDMLDSSTLDIIAQVSTTQNGLGWCQNLKKIASNQYLLACAKGLRCWNSQSGKLNLIDEKLEGEFIENIVGFENNQALIHATKSGLWLYTNNLLSPFDSQDLSEYGDIKKIYQQTEFAWLVYDKHIIQLDSDLHILSHLELPNDLSDIRVVYQNEENSVLVADEHRLIQLARDDDSLLTIKTLHIDLCVNDIARDRYGNTWIASDFSGLLKIPVLDSLIKNYQPNRKSSILSIQMAPKSSGQQSSPVAANELLLGGTNSSFHFNSEYPESAQEIPSLRNIACWDLKNRADNGYWAATNKGLLSLSHLAQAEAKFFIDERVGAGRCISFYQDTVIYGSVSGLFLFDIHSKHFKALLAPDNKTIGYVYSTKQLSEEELLISTLGNGVWRYKCDSQKLEQVYTSLNTKNVYDIDIDHNGRLLFAADNKLWLVDKEIKRLLFESKESVVAWCCRWYSAHQVVLGTSNGLKIFDLERKEITFVVDEFPRHQFSEFTTARSLLVESEVNFWCGLNEGLQCVKLRELERIVHQPIPEIMSIHSNADFKQKSGKLRIQEGSWSLQINIGCAWLWQEHSLSYEFRLVGLLPEWRKIDGNRIQLMTLPVGEYVLEVRVSNNLAQSKKSYQLLLITVEAESWMAHIGIATLEASKKAFSKYRMLRHFFQTQQSYEEMERLVQHRTLELSMANKELEKLNESLANLSAKDQLTGLYNRRYFFEQINNEIKRSMRDKLPLSVLMFDIDYFKKYNDNYGHLAGDTCLKKVAETLKHQFVRSGELVARFGGEEFIALMHNTTTEEALTLAQRCVEEVNSLQEKHEFSECSDVVTLSVGVVSQTPVYQAGKESWVSFRQQIIAKADEALYLAKENGRNQAFIYK